jgi:outer membrane cobalamin receptor
MKTLKLATIGAALLVLAAVAGEAVAAPNDQPGDRYAYVFVTGSRIPQKVKIKAIGTNTASPLRVYKRNEIDQTGRFTTADVLAQDPSVRVISGRAGGGN